MGDLTFTVARNSGVIDGLALNGVAWHATVDCVTRFCAVAEVLIVAESIVGKVGYVSGFRVTQVHGAIDAVLQDERLSVNTARLG